MGDLNTWLQKSGFEAFRDDVECILEKFFKVKRGCVKNYDATRRIMESLQSQFKLSVSEGKLRQLMEE